MFLFSSLIYLLKRALLAFNQTVSTELPLNVELKSSNQVSLINESESWTINTTSYSICLHLLSGAGNFSDKDDTNNLFDFSAIKKWTNLTFSLPTSNSKVHIEIEHSNTRESKFQFPNET